MGCKLAGMSQSQRDEVFIISDGERDLAMVMKASHLSVIDCIPFSIDMAVAINVNGLSCHNYEDALTLQTSL